MFTGFRLETYGHVIKPFIRKYSDIAFYVFILSEMKGLMEAYFDTAMVDFSSRDIGDVASYKVGSY